MPHCIWRLKESVFTNVFVWYFTLPHYLILLVDASAFCAVFLLSCIWTSIFIFHFSQFDHFQFCVLYSPIVFHYYSDFLMLWFSGRAFVLLFVIIYKLVLLTAEKIRIYSSSLRGLSSAFTLVISFHYLSLSSADLLLLFLRYWTCWSIVLSVWLE